MRFLMAAVLAVASLSHAQTASFQTQARPAINKAIDYLRNAQDTQTGGWNHHTDQPNFPAISALVVNGFLLDPRIDQNDPAVRKAVQYILSFQKPDGTIHDGVLESYNTAICLSALARVHSCDAANAITHAQSALRAMQWQAEVPQNAQAYNEPVDQNHPFFGGVGYGKHSRPDLSNLGFALQALHDSGVSSEDPAFKRALVFLQRTQMDHTINDQPYAAHSEQGGFIYSTLPDAQSVENPTGDSEAGMLDEQLPDGSTISRQRAYGSMTYVGFKSLIYADLAHEDPRVQAALRWISQNYSMTQNPGVGKDGLYYYYLAMARAFDAFGQDTIPVTTDHGTRHADWRQDLISALLDLQNPDGSFRSLSNRWMENDPVLITAYSLIALEIASNG